MSEGERRRTLRLAKQRKEEERFKQPRPGITPSELLERYAAGEREFIGVQIVPSEEQRNNGFSKIDLSNVDLKEIILRDSIISSTGFRWGLSIEGIDLSYADLRDTNFYGLRLTGSNFRGADLRNAKFASTSMEHCDFTRADLREADISCSDLSCSKLSYANLEGVDGAEVAIVASDLSHANLMNGEFEQAYFEDSNFTNVCFDNAYFGRIAAHFGKANLTNATFRNVSMDFEELTSWNSVLRHCILNNTITPEGYVRDSERDLSLED